MNIITKLNIRQKVMLALTILAAVFLAWQIYHFIQGNAAPVQPSAAPVAAAALPVSTLPPPVVVRQLPASAPVLTPRQREYLNLVREYQITKMERQILEEKAGLANAQKRISDSGTNNSLSGASGIGTSMYSNENNDYQLAYIDRQAGQWSATLNQGEVYKEVHVGTRLENGSKVLSINGNRVVLSLVKGKKLVLTFQGSVNVDNETPAYTVKAKTPVKNAQPVANAVLLFPFPLPLPAMRAVRAPPMAKAMLKLPKCWVLPQPRSLRLLPVQFLPRPRM